VVADEETELDAVEETVDEADVESVEDAVEDAVVENEVISHSKSPCVASLTAVFKISFVTTHWSSP
jgi:ribosomal protein L21